MIEKVAELAEFETALKQRLKPVSWADLHNFPKRDYLIKHLLDRSAMSVVYGESNSGKTFLALQMAIHIALGEVWRGRRVTKGTVVYIAAEGGLGLAERLEAFKKYFELKDFPPLYVIPVSIDLCDPEKDTADIIEEIQALDDVVLVVIDTLSRAMSGGNENSPDDMGAFVFNCDRIRQQTGVHVMVVHHSGKDAAKGARGHSLLKAATDTEIEVKQENGIISALVHKQRDGKTGDVFRFSLHVVEIGEDKDGDPVSSCVLLPTDEAPKQRRKLSGQKERALDILQNCIIDKGQKRSVRRGIPAVMCVTLDEYRQALQAGNISGSDKMDSVSRAITRAIDDLNNLSITVSYGSYIWLADKPDKTGQTKINNNPRPDRQDKTL